jgi:tetratricopeptide (TPR) repeat protein
MTRFLILAAYVAAFSLPALAAEGTGPDISKPDLTLEQKREEALDMLFGELHGVGDEGAAAIEQKIWTVWAKPLSDTAGVLLGQADRAMGANESDAAKAVLDQTIAAYPQFAEAWNKRATLAFARGDYGSSLKDIEQVLALEPRHFGALAGRGMIYQAQKKWSDALAAYREALTINPHMPGVKDAIKQIEKIEREI